MIKKSDCFPFQGLGSSGNWVKSTSYTTSLFFSSSLLLAALIFALSSFGSYSLIIGGLSSLSPVLIEPAFLKISAYRSIFWEAA